MHEPTQHSTYDPNRLLNSICQHLGLQSDGALSRKMKVARNVIRDIRERRVPVAASILVLMHEVTGISIDELRFLMGDRRARLRPCYVIRQGRSGDAQRVPA